MVGARAPGTQRVSYFTRAGLVRGGQGGRARARGAARASVPGGLGARTQKRSKFRNVCRIFVVSNAYKKKKNGGFLKDALWGGGGVTHRSWPGGRGVGLAGQGWVGTHGGGVQGLRFREGRW